MKRSWVIALAILLVAMLGIWRGCARSVDERSKGVANPRVDSESALSHSLDAPESKDARSVSPTVVAADTIAPVTSASPTEGTEILVIDERTQDTVAGAEIVVLGTPSAADLQKAELWSRAGTLVHSIDTTKAAITTDERGRALLPRFDRGTIVAARIDDRRALALVDPRVLGRVVLELHRDPSITVKVIDADRAPLMGIGVALRMEGAYDTHNAMTAVTEGPQGLATLSHVGLVFAHCENQTVAVAIDGLLDPPVQVTLDRERLPDAPIVLVLPPSGELEVLLRHTDGTPAVETAALRAAVISDTEADVAGLELIRWSTELRDGRALIQHVTTGRKFRVWAFFPGSWPATRVEVRGPEHAGERATCFIENDAEPTVPTLAARILDERGEPLSSTNVTFILSRPETRGSGSCFGIRTDRAGRIRWTLPQSWATEGPADLTIRPNSVMSSTPQPISAQVRLPAILPTGVTNVGDIRLARDPHFVSGYVVDGANRPVPGARVWVDVNDVQWSQLDSISGRSDTSGRFELYGSTSADTFYLRAECPGAVSPRVTFQRGARDVVVVLGSTGEIAGTLKLPPGVLHSDLWLTCSSDELDTRMYSQGRVIEPNGAFRITGLVPTTYRFSVVTISGDPAVFALNGLHVLAGETTRPPELDPLDLTHTLFLHAFAVFDPAGQPLVGCAIDWRRSGDPLDPGSTMTFDNARLRLVTGDELLDVDVHARGMRDAHLRRVSGSHDVVLKRAPTVRLVLRGSTPLPAPPYLLRPILVAAANATEDGEMTGSAFTSSRVSIVTATEIGRVEVQLGIFKAHTSFTTIRTRPDALRFITIEDTLDEQTFELDISPGELERAIATMPR